MLRPCWILSILIFAACLIACSGSGTKPPEAGGDPNDSAEAAEAKAKRIREADAAESRWQTRLAKERQSLADAAADKVEEAEGHVANLIAERDDAAKKHKANKDRGYVTLKQDADFKLKHKDREDKIVAATAERDTAKKQLGSAGSWEPREEPKSLPRGEVARLSEGVVFVVEKEVRPGELIVTYGGATYWIEGMPRGQAVPGNKLTVEALVEYTGDRPYNDRPARVVRAYARNDDYERTGDSAAGGSAGGSGGGKTVHVKGYTRKDGTMVQPHDRRPPGGKR